MMNTAILTALLIGFSQMTHFLVEIEDSADMVESGSDYASGRHII